MPVEAVPVLRLQFAICSPPCDPSGCGWKLAVSVIGWLAPLPVSALRLGPEVNRTLQRLGLRTIGALAGIERKPLARRFREADNPLDAIDRALGRKSEPVIAVTEEAPPRAALRLAEPVAHPRALLLL